MVRRRLRGEHRFPRWRVGLLALIGLVGIPVAAAMLMANGGGQTILSTLLDNPALVAGNSDSVSSTTAPDLVETTQPLASTTVSIRDSAHVADITGAVEGQPGNWAAQVEVLIVTTNAPQGAADAIVLGTWSGGTLTTHTARTDALGVAGFALSNLAGASTMFTVLDVIAADVTYDPIQNATTSLVVRGPTS